VRDHIVLLKTQAELKPLQMTCPECNNSYSQEMTLDMTSFFEVAS